MAITARKRNAVAQRARYCCKYRRSQLKYSADSFSVEHIVACAFGGFDDLSNPALACQRCNNAKFIAVEAINPLTGQPALLFHPRQHNWSQHFAWSHDSLLLHGLTPTGRATIEKLQLNREGVVNLRRVLREAGEHPPAIDRRAAGH